MSKQVYWCGLIGEKDDFGAPIGNEFVDGKTRHGPWAIMSMASWAAESGTGGALGLGLGQKYSRQVDGRWLKVAG